MDASKALILSLQGQQNPQILNTHTSGCAHGIVANTGSKLLPFQSKLVSCPLPESDIGLTRYRHGQGS